MVDRSVVERLQPSLLDRLTDQAPDNTRDSVSDSAIDIRRLREIVQRDLSWLLNATNGGRLIDARLYPRAAASVLNYGVEEVSGNFSTSDRAMSIRSAIRLAIERFEPRLNPGTLEVILQAGESSARAVIVFDIHGDLWADPVPLELYLRSSVDLTTGQVALERLS